MDKKGVHNVFSETTQIASFISHSLSVSFLWLFISALHYFLLLKPFNLWGLHMCMMPVWWPCMSHFKHEADTYTYGWASLDQHIWGSGYDDFLCRASIRLWWNNRWLILFVMVKTEMLSGEFEYWVWPYKLLVNLLYFNTAYLCVETLKYKGCNVNITDS